MRIGLVAVGVLLSSCAVHRFECERHGGAAVVRIESVGDLPGKELRVEVLRLERLWDAFALMPACRLNRRRE